MKRQHFSLIELLIVIGILGVLVTLVLPGFSNTADQAKEKAAMTEMREIQAAFRRFAEDTMLKSNTTKMQDIVKYGIWPLISQEHPISSSTITYTDYDAETGIGRRGPYLRKEGEEDIKIDTFLDTTGQENNSGASAAAVTIPVIKDPYGGYYRVICPPENDGTTSNTDTEKTRLLKMVLICTGPDKTIDDASKTLNTSNFDIDEKTVTNDGDDLVIRLMPLATY